MAIKNSKLTKFTSLLKELFQLNQPELDFGIYRIMHARKDDINRFIEQDLPQVVKKAFGGFESQDKVVVEQELAKAIKQAEDLGVPPESISKVQELKEQLSQSIDTGREEGEVYDALLTFFSRYYDEGDFISRRVYKEGTYAIPYSGEEVTLHWANKDQYYIKSSESLRDFCFRLKSEQPENPMRVHFRVVDAEAGAQNNNKEADDAKRVFILDQENPWEIKDNELNIYFYYRASNLDDWTDDALEKATAAAKKKPPTLEHLKQIAEQRLLDLNGGVDAEWRELLEVEYIKTDGEKADYSVLMSQLNLYTKKNTFDYFIHKNLGEFLTRELDFYIKNELFRWEDISNMKSNPARMAPLLSKIEVIRTIGEKIIAFLAQLEDFQKKLWLKKKFVTETNYCITLDRLAEQPDLLDEIIANNAQRQQWQELVALDLEQFDQDIKAGDWITRDKYRYLMVDTGLFDQIFKARVMSRVDGLDEQCDGVLINGDNFHAQLLIRERLQGQVKISYIDPPYNTGKDGFLYKDNYLHSSWASFMYDRLNQTKALTSDDGATFISIDDSESQNIEYIGKTVFGEENHLVNFFIQVRYANKTLSEDSDFHKTIEKVLYFAKDTTKHKPNKTKAEYDVDKFTWSIEVSEPETSFEAGGRLVEVFTDGQYEINKVSPHLQGLKETWATGSLLRQKGSSGEYFGLNLAPRKDIDGLNTLYKVYGIGEDGLGYRYFTGPKKATATRGKFYSGIPLDTLEKINTGDSSKELPIHNFYDMAGDFGNCRHEGKVDIKGGKKPEVLLQQLINFSCNPDKEEWLLEPFSGSGTGVSVALKSGKKFIGLEQGSYFDEKIIRRLKYTAYGKSGEGERGISSCFKYIRLESYEDTLTNLQLKRTQVQQDLLSSNSADEQSAREAYLLNYMLDVETQGSASLLDISKFVDPTAYQLKVRNPAGDETKLINVDLLETFNWLLGLTVEHISVPIHFSADLSQADHGRWQADVKRQADGEWWFRTVAGTNRKGQKVLIVWRNLPSVIANEANGLVMDNAVLDAVLIDKLSVRMTESQDDEFDVLYVNGDHNITIPKNRQGGLMESRVKLIEEDFHRLMFSSVEH